MSELHVKLEIDTSRFVEAMNEVAEVLTRLRRVAPWVLDGAPDAHHPRPLSIDGHAYHRRVRNRRKRR